MAEPLKNHFSVNVPQLLAQHIQRVYPDFQVEAFIKSALNGFESLELLPRGKKLAHDLKPFLPDNFEASAQILLDSMVFPLTHTESKSMSAFFYMPHLNYVAFYGLEHPEISLNTLKKMTQKFSAEFAIRPFIETHSDFVFSVLHEWKNDKNVHVRRLVSEGTRPLLPWASRLRALERDPSPSIPLLEHLVDDVDLYVRRSVANHVNDISKHHPELAISLCETWAKKPSPERIWVIKQALRTLIKKGNPRAIQVFGFDSSDDLSIENSVLEPKIVRFGESLTFQFDVKNESNQAKKVIIDFAIHFVKANGESNAKVFKLTTQELKAKSSVSIRKSIKFQPLTTRVHYPGKHQIDVLLNGKSFVLGSFDLLMD